MINNDNIKLIRELKWEEVFCFWYENEGTRENWNQLARDRGFASWADWRLSAYALPFDCRNAKWGLYEISKPAETVSDFYGGPFRTWVEKYYQGEERMKFSELIKNQEVTAH